MHVHLPKPLHGWREFFGEVGIIVVGVLIALGAEQVVEKLHWREKASHAREALKSEVEAIYRSSAERMVSAPCLSAQLDQLKANVLTDGARSALPTSATVVGPMVYRHPNRIWTQAVWQSTNAEQVVSHLYEAERSNLSELYASVELSREMNRQEFASASQLMVLASPLVLDANLKGQMLAAIESERLRVGAMTVLAHQQMQIAEQAFPDVKDALDRAEWRSEMQGPASTIGWCRAQKLPIGQLP